MNTLAVVAANFFKDKITGANKQNTDIKPHSDFCHRDLATFWSTFGGVCGGQRPISELYCVFERDVLCGEAAVLDETFSDITVSGDER